MSSETHKTTQNDNTKILDDWLTIKQLNSEIEINTDTQAKYRSAGTIPFYKVGKRILYRKSEINEWLLSHKVV